MKPSSSPFPSSHHHEARHSIARTAGVPHLLYFLARLLLHLPLPHSAPSTTLSPPSVTPRPPSLSPSHSQSLLLLLYPSPPLPSSVPPTAVRSSSPTPKSPTPASSAPPPQSLPKPSIGCPSLHRTDVSVEHSSSIPRCHSLPLFPPPDLHGLYPLANPLSTATPPRSSSPPNSSSIHALIDAARSSPLSSSPPPSPRCSLLPHHPDPPFVPCHRTRSTTLDHLRRSHHHPSPIARSPF